ncbi:hypothetical protein [Oceanibacterium hippocampi]|uniref:hypothetical protein n=1 Tax=Oceanibacterium hippocampi TaxID=745714 RepID=UPI0015949066|nr:hypothetical protein [Oceanibacterium hippocampi]
MVYLEAFAPRQNVQPAIADPPTLRCKLAKYRQVTGLDQAVIIKTLGRHGKFYVDRPLFNAWLTGQNRWVAVSGAKQTGHAQSVAGSD